MESLKRMVILVVIITILLFWGIRGLVAATMFCICAFILVGSIISKDKEETIRVMSTHERGDLAIENNNQQAVEVIFRQLGDNGDIPSQRTLALRQAQKFGLFTDEGLRWFEMAAEIGESNAQINLGNFYKSRIYFRNEIGYIHRRGNIGWNEMADGPQALMWFIIAANSEPQAVKMRDQLIAQMSPDQIQRAENMAQEWLERHSPKG